MSQHTPQARTLTAEAVSIRPGSLAGKLHVVGAVLAALGGVGCIVLAPGDVKQFHFSYLVAFLFFLSISLGGLWFVMVQFVTRSGWSVVLRRLAENVMGALPLFALLFVPVAIGAHDLFHWTHAEAVAKDPILQHKQPYLNVGFFFGRAVVYLVIWSALALYFRSRSVRQDQTGDHAITRRLQAVSAPGIVLLALSLTFAAFDWIMSLDPHWFSTIFGVYYFSGAALAIYAVLALLTVGLSRAGGLGGAVSHEHFHDIGKMLFAFVAFWTYIAFSQYFLIWYANIPEETMWYLHRWEGGWKGVTVALAVGHFVVPFFFLLPRRIKRNPRTLVAGAVWMLGVHMLDIYWLVMPQLHHHGPHISPLDASAFLLVGGLWLGVVGWLMRGSALVPVKDPRLSESLAFENI